VLGLQDARGGFHATPRARGVVTHAHCYAVEGLFYAAAVLETPRWADAALRGARWLLSKQHPDGWVAIAYDRRWWTLGRRALEVLRPVGVLDATAQAARLWMIAAGSSGDAAFGSAARRACRFIEEQQCRDGRDPAALGGLPYSPGHPMLLAWPAMFAAQALQAAAAGSDTRTLIDELF
jgi:hypothetical protein